MFAQRMKELRIDRGLMQRSVADGLNIAESSYQIYEYGRKKPGFDKLIDIANYFDVSLDYLVGRTDNPYVNQ